MQRPQEFVCRRVDDAGVPLRVRGLEPFERLVHLAPVRVGLGNLVRGGPAPLVDQRLQRLVRFLRMSKGVMDHRERKVAEDIVRLVRRQRQSLLGAALQQACDREKRVGETASRIEVERHLERDAASSRRSDMR